MSSAPSGSPDQAPNAATLARLSLSCSPTLSRLGPASATHHVAGGGLEE
jgi:hypothetical protein